EYTSVKERLSKEVEDLKTSHKGELAKLKEECDDQLGKMKENHAVEVEKLKEEAKAQGELASKLTKERDAAMAVSSDLAEEKAALEEDVNGLQIAISAQYEEGFLFALEQMK
ncbi:hypothetical protein A2U01_0063033, partial [Trifolium medium]|nr:hypothetical protein [Trifolium medium]